MNEWELLISLGIIILGVRSSSWWLHSWQLREYRLDRMLSHCKTHDGRKNLWNLWFFPGLLPRPIITGRVIIITALLISFSIIEISLVHEAFTEASRWNWNWAKALIVWERTLWLLIPIVIKISAIPVWARKRAIYRKAGEIIAKGKNVTCIGITGSYGKTSTKKILVHLLVEKYGADAVLTNPGNENNELAIARLVKRNRRFFEDPTTGPQKRFFVCEAGAYRTGEIRRVCNFLNPKIGILTGLNAQHVDLFGSAEKLRAAKFELAEACREKIFFNADTPALVEIFNDQKITATPIGISKSAAKDIKSDIEKTEFHAYGKDFTLPWAGVFFISNALLSIEVARELGCDTQELADNLKTIPKLERALHTKKLENGATILLDPYSANPDGVLGAVGHLEKFTGKKIFVGIPLRELGPESEAIHEELFEKLADLDAEVFWFRHDYEKMAQELCGKKFHGGNIKKLTEVKKDLKENDAVLLESRLPQNVEKLFQ